MTVKIQAKEQTLEDKLRNTAELLRDKASSTTYKNIALGLLFPKFTSNRYDVKRVEIENETTCSNSNKLIPTHIQYDEYKKKWYNQLINMNQ